MDKLKTKKERWLLPAALLVIVLICFAPWYLRVIHLATPSVYERVSSDNGVWDFSDVDFENGFVRANGSVEYIPGELLTPEEFEQREDEALTGHPVDDPVNTSRLIIIVPDDGPYMLEMNSIDFSERLYINGQWMQDAGTPGLTADTSTPGFAHMYFDVQPVNGVIEIVRQSSNFVHRENSGASGVYVGRPELIKQHIALQTDLYAFSVGIYFALFLAHGLLFIVLRSYKANLCFALLCLTWGLRTGVSGVKIFTSWFSNLSWYFTFRLEYLTAPLAALLIILIIRQVFSDLLPKWFVRGTVGAFLLYAVCCLLLPTVVLSYTMIGFEVFFIAAIVFVLVMFALRIPRRVRTGDMQPEHWVTLAGLVIFFLTTAHDALYYNNIFVLQPLLGQDYLLGDLALMVFSFFQMTAMFYATMRQVREAIEQRQKLAVENAALDRVNTMKSELMANLTHELRTPLAVMSAYSQLTVEAVRRGEINEQTTGHLELIMSESKRLADMASGVLHVFRDKEASSGMTAFSVATVIEQVGRLTSPMLEESGNKLTFTIPESLPLAFGRA